MVKVSSSIKTIAVVGDIHDQWEAEDGEALHHLGVDLVLFVGDLGNESIEIVREIASLDIPKAVILGNHDAWYSASEWGRKKSPYDHTKEDRVQQQLDLLGETHVGYSKLDFPQLELTVVGARPFSWGGSEWKNHDFYQKRYGIANFAESSQRIIEAVQQATYDSVIFLGHCGPLGLGDRPEDPCGKDWQPLGGDHGDPDFAEAIVQTRQLGKTIPLVTFGHMHHTLRHTKQVLRTPITTEQETLYLNAASVPRILPAAPTRQRNFSLVQLRNHQVEQASLIWIDDRFKITAENVLYRRVNEAQQQSQPEPQLHH